MSRLFPHSFMGLSVGPLNAPMQDSTSYQSALGMVPAKERSQCIAGCNAINEEDGCSRAHMQPLAMHKRISREHLATIVLASFTDAQGMPSGNATHLPVDPWDIHTQELHTVASHRKLAVGSSGRAIVTA